MTDQVLSVTGLHALRGGAEVVRDFNMVVTRGEVVGLLGPNGAGKSTAVDAICGLADKRSGSVLFEGEDVTRYPPHALARRGLIQISQSQDLFVDMTVEENLILGRQAAGRRGAHEATLARTLEVFPRLQERLSQRAGSLSGGERQMLAIARGLMGEPKLVLLDEPSAGLAPVIVNQIGQLLSELTTQGLTLVLIEQNVQVALSLCSRFVVMKAGDEVFTGTKDELGEDPRGRLAELYV
jgi:branched-chain amino acid transport system ATP-binding protein